MSVESLVEALAGSVKKAGITRISEVIADDRIFDRQFVHPGWPKDQLDRWYCAEVSGLNFHTNMLSVFPSPSSAGLGHPPSMLMEPSAPFLDIENKARTGPAGRNSIRLAREGDTNRFTVLGEVGVSRTRADSTVHDPSLFAAQVLAAALPGAGVAIGAVPGLGDSQTRVSQGQLADAARAARVALPEEKFGGGRVVAAVTTRLEDVLQRCNTDSHNLYAEAMIKRIGNAITGEPGSWVNGSSVIRMTLAQHLGPEAASSAVIADGSGMSREDRVSPRTLARWLDALQKDPSIGEAFVASLATPDKRESLRRRFRDIRLTNALSAKTGTIDGVRCLSGILTDPTDGHRLAFSIMVNDLKEGEQTLQALEFHEAVVAAADRWLTAQRPAKPDPVAAPPVSPRTHGQGRVSKPAGEAVNGGR
jgi:serine-type D-Ala-D-Ala carboxypeptidase/endopeptidase (penicillin-binding protein 4)